MSQWFQHIKRVYNATKHQTMHQPSLLLDQLINLLNFHECASKQEVFLLDSPAGFGTPDAINYIAR